jgi:hypothetical protein
MSIRHPNTYSNYSEDSLECSFIKRADFHVTNIWSVPTSEYCASLSAPQNSCEKLLKRFNVAFLPQYSSSELKIVVLIEPTNLFFLLYLTCIPGILIHPSNSTSLHPSLLHSILCNKSEQAFVLTDGTTT